MALCCIWAKVDHNIIFSSSVCSGHVSEEELLEEDESGDVNEELEEDESGSLQRAIPSEPENKEDIGDPTGEDN